MHVRSIHFLLVLVCVTCIVSPLLPSKKINSLIDSVDVIHVASLQQNVLNKDEVELIGDVEVIIDKKMRLWADRVEINKKEQMLFASSQVDSVISIETEGILVTTDHFRLNLKNRTGYATDIKMHFDGGFVSAKKMTKFPENYWELEQIVYTPCDAHRPHWSIHAKSASIYSNYLIKASRIVLYAQDLPVFLMPTLVVPLQGQTQSGFLLPKFSYDQEFGFGFRQDFYWKIAPRCDTTIGFAWKSRRGIVLSDELRWARGPDRFTTINAHYARERNAFVKNSESIIKGVQEHYWIEGDNYEPIQVGNHTLKSLLRADFGTDKRVGYFFFNSTKRVSDYFYNALTLRHCWDTWNYNVLANGEKTIRNQFTDVTAQELGIPEICDNEDIANLKEREDKYTVIRVPRFDAASTYKKHANIIYCSHNLFVDSLVARQFSQELLYQKGQLTDVRNVLSHQHFDTFRMMYQARLESHVSLFSSLIRPWIAPQIQLRSSTRNKSDKAQSGAVEHRILSKGRARIFIQGGVEWALPERIMTNNDVSYMHCIQPIINWEFNPHFAQDHWFLADKYDKYFAVNELSFDIQNSWYFDDVHMDLSTKIAYEFNKPSSILPLRRGIREDHLLPVTIDWGLSYKNLLINLCQEYELRNARLGHFALNVEYTYKKSQFYLGCLYQERSLQKRREFYSDIPLFLYIGLDAPLFKQLKLRYHGQFYARGDSWRTAGSGIRPLIHRIYLEYKGHCWSVLCGFEEKRYRQQGNWRNENAFVFSFSLDTLGSFAGRLKKPVLADSAWY